MRNLNMSWVIKKQRERECLRDTEMGGDYVPLLLEQIPEERTVRGWYDERPRDLVDIFDGR